MKGKMMGKFVLAVSMAIGAATCWGNLVDELDPIGPGQYYYDLTDVCRRAWNYNADMFKCDTGDLLYGSEDSPFAAVTFKVGRKNSENQVKVSATAVSASGKRYSAPATTVKLRGAGGIGYGDLKLNFGDELGTFYCAMQVDSAESFYVDGWSYSGYRLSRSISRFYLPNGLDIGEPVFCCELARTYRDSGYMNALSMYVPNGFSFLNQGKRWVFPKASGLKYVRNPGEEWYELVEYGKTYNPSGLKLTYNSKNRLFKGSFKLYTVKSNGQFKKPTLKKTNVIVTGFVLTDGEWAEGVASCRQHGTTGRAIVVDRYMYRGYSEYFWGAPY